MDRKVWLKSQCARALNLKLILCYCTSILGVKKQQQLRKKKKQEMKEERKKERKKERSHIGATPKTEKLESPGSRGRPGLVSQRDNDPFRGPGVDQVW